VKTSNILKNYILIITTLFSTIGYAQNKSQQELINQNRRPKVSDILNNQDNLEMFDSYDSDGRAAAVRSKVAGLIVGLEKAFPGGTYGFLGRDMDLIADAVDSFYQGIGQKDRVQRIEFSTPSLTGSNPKLITDFLSQRGLDSTAKTNAGPLILIDYTSFANNGRTNSSFPSQARYIFESVITEMKKNGISDEVILSKINVTTIDPHASGNVSLNDPFTDSRENFLKEQTESLSKNGKVDRITYIPVNGDSMAYHSEWHDKFGPINVSQNGLLETTPVRFFDYNQKRIIYNQIILTITYMLSDEFKTKVNELASQYGVVFKASGGLKSQIKKIKNVKINLDLIMKNNLEALFDLKELPAEKNYEKYKFDSSKISLTENGNAVMTALLNNSHHAAEHFFEISFETLIKLYKTKKIGARDFRRIFAHVLTVKEIENNSFLKQVNNKYKEILPLEIMLGREIEREKYSTQGGIGQSNFLKLTGSGTLKLSCKFVY
jgi:hypothetical protein